MSTNSNKPSGNDFSRSVGQYLNHNGFAVRREYEFEVGINSLVKKPHKFDWGNDILLVECKAYNWLRVRSHYPGGLFATANEAVLYFMAVPKSYRKMLFLWETERRSENDPETFAEYYVRLFQHLIPTDIEVYEFNANNLTARHLWPPPSK